MSEQAQTSAPRKHEGPPKAERSTCVSCRVSLPVALMHHTALGPVCNYDVACRKRQRNLDAKRAKAS